MDPLPAQIGKYRVTGAVGRGGMAVILNAHDPDLERDVAIKLIRTTLLSTPDSRSRTVDSCQGPPRRGDALLTRAEADTEPDRLSLFLCL